MSSAVVNAGALNAATDAVAASTVPPIETSQFIANRSYDLAFFILSPLLALALSFTIGLFRWPFEPVEGLGSIQPRVLFFGLIWTYAHLFAVVFRSHANPQIFNQHRLRFTVIPAVVFAVLLLSSWAVVFAILLAALWDVYHTSMQTFGFCRIYDSKRGNPPERGRTLDVWINHVVYIGPILGGLSLLTTIEGAHGVPALGWSAPARIYAWVAAAQPMITDVVVVAGTAFCLYYVFAYGRLVRTGYVVSWQKVSLLVSTAVTSIYAWGFLQPLEAFFVANFFHALQYYAIVWWTEKKAITRAFGLSRLAGGQVGALVAYIVAIAGVGAFMASEPDVGGDFVVALVLTIALMHFWYDSFVWSVRRKEV